MIQHYNSIMRGASGALGKELVFRQRAGKTVICLPPVRRQIKSSEIQQAFRTRFGEASKYAKYALTDPLKKAAYAAKAKAGQTANNVAVADFLNAPVIVSAEAPNYSGTPGDIISACVTDDFKVQSVHVIILSEAGDTLEEGAASSSTDGHNWTYTLANTYSVTAKALLVARDMPGNASSMELLL